MIGRAILFFMYDELRKAKLVEVVIIDWMAGWLAAAGKKVGERLILFAYV